MVRLARASLFPKAFQIQSTPKCTDFHRHWVWTLWANSPTGPYFIHSFHSFRYLLPVKSVQGTIQGVGEDLLAEWKCHEDTCPFTDCEVWGRDPEMEPEIYLSFGVGLCPSPVFQYHKGYWMGCAEGICHQTLCLEEVHTTQGACAVSEEPLFPLCK